ncbi:hypothetical protein G5V59_27290 [Nocardioides sp. W3-2-3]|nr:hypothetical protein [Nocardioides convexus]
MATGEQATPASDVWALGATLVHLLTGRPPYHRDDADNGPLAVVYRIVHEDPPVVPGAEWLAPLLAATMARDPAQRPTMAAVRDQARASRGGLAEQTMAMAPMPPPPPPPPAPRARRPFPVRVVAAAAGTAAALAVATVAVLALQGRDDGTGDRAAATRTPATSATTPAAADKAPTAADLQTFAENYVRTASTDPDAGFTMLTPAYQRTSTEYADFWGQMSKPKILAISADPAAMTVTYTYSYRFAKQGKRTETVTLHLVREDGKPAHLRGRGRFLGLPWPGERVRRPARGPGPHPGRPVPRRRGAAAAPGRGGARRAAHARPGARSTVPHGDSGRRRGPRPPGRRSGSRVVGRRAGRRRPGAGRGAELRHDRLGGAEPRHRLARTAHRVWPCGPTRGSDRRWRRARTTCAPGCRRRPVPGAPPARCWRSPGPR